MSGLIVGLVLRYPISGTFNTEAKFVATVYADHAWEDGTHAHPAVDTVAGITGLSARTVQRYLRALELMGMMILSGKGPRGTNQYSFPIEGKDDGSVRLNIARGDSLTPRQADGGDTESGDTESGDTAMSPKQTTRPVLVVVNVDFAEICKAYEQEFGALTPMIADAIKDTCDTYSAEWILEAMQIAVSSNRRSWNYVQGILKNCKAKNVRPALNKFDPKERNYANNRTGNPKRTDETPAAYSDDDRAAAEHAKKLKAERRVAVS